MFNSSDILARLQNGENPETIANEMADCLNQAVTIHNATELEGVLDCAADDISTYLTAKYPKECETLGFDLDGEDLGEILDALMTVLPVLNDLQDMIPVPVVKKSCGPTCGCHEDIDPIAAFLSEMGLKQ